MFGKLSFTKKSGSDYKLSKGQDSKEFSLTEGKKKEGCKKNKEVLEGFSSQSQLNKGMMQNLLGQQSYWHFREL